MHRTSLPKIFIFFTIYSYFVASSVLGQTKLVGEVDFTKCWAYPTGDVSGEVLASDGLSLFIGFRGAKVGALSMDGKKMWSSEFGGEIGSNILPSESGLLFAASTITDDANKPGGSMLRSVSKQTGITNWTLKLPDAKRHFLGSFNNTVIVVSKNGVIHSVDTKSGAVKWKREIAEGFVAEPAFKGGKVFVATIAKQIFGVSLVSGEIDSVQKVQFAVTAIGQTVGGQLVTGDERGNVALITNGTDKANWKFKSGGEISAIFTVEDHLLVTSHDNFVYYLGDYNGGRAWKKRLSGRLSHVANVMDRYALISSYDEHGAVLIELTNGKVVGQLTFDENEELVFTPLASNGLIFVLTNEAAHAYSLNGCPPNKPSGLGQIVRDRRFKITSAANPILNAKRLAAATLNKSRL